MQGLPELPYYAVIFSSCKSDNLEGYSEMDVQCSALAQTMPGFLGIEHGSNGSNGVTVSYWKDEESIRNWKQNAVHQIAQKMGCEKWYEYYSIRVAKVERHYESLTQ